MKHNLNKKELLEKLEVNTLKHHDTIQKIRDAIKENDRTPKKIVKPLLSTLDYHNEMHDTLIRELLDYMLNELHKAQSKNDLIKKKYLAYVSGDIHITDLLKYVEAFSTTAKDLKQLNNKEAV